MIKNHCETEKKNISEIVVVVFLYLKKKRKRKKIATMQMTTLKYKLTRLRCDGSMFRLSETSPLPSRLPVPWHVCNTRLPRRKHRWPAVCRIRRECLAVERISCVRLTSDLAESNSASKNEYDELLVCLLPSKRQLLMNGMSYSVKQYVTPMI